jgi:hypothetical protein
MFDTPRGSDGLHELDRSAERDIFLSLMELNVDDAVDTFEKQRSKEKAHAVRKKLKFHKNSRAKMGEANALAAEDFHKNTPQDSRGRYIA